MKCARTFGAHAPPCSKHPMLSQWLAVRAAFLESRMAPFFSLCRSTACQREEAKVKEGEELCSGLSRVNESHP